MEQLETLEFIFFPPSPWSERARWALEHSGIPFNIRVYTPMISTPKVRWMTRNFTGKLTVPVAIHGQTILRDSLDIALYANARRESQRSDLFPANQMEPVRQWNRLSEDLLTRLRARAFPRMRNSRELKLNNLPPVFPAPVRPWFLPLSDMALRNFEKKYPVNDNNDTALIVSTLQQVRDSLADNGNDYLLGDFTYADITVAALFQCISPVSDEYVPLDHATRSCWTDPELKSQFSDLLAWRDRIYQNHRHAHQDTSAAPLPA